MATGQPTWPAPTTYVPAVDAPAHFALPQKTAVLLYPRRADVPDPFVSKLGGCPAWPRDEPWPRCPARDCNAPLAPVVQLTRADVPELPFPGRADLFQVLWCPEDHGISDQIDFADPFFWGSPTRVYWRAAREIGRARGAAPRARGKYNNYSQVPVEFAVFPERVAEVDTLGLGAERLAELNRWGGKPSPGGPGRAGRAGDEPGGAVQPAVRGVPGNQSAWVSARRARRGPVGVRVRQGKGAAADGVQLGHRGRVERVSVGAGRRAARGGRVSAALGSEGVGTVLGGHGRSAFARVRAVLGQAGFGRAAGRLRLAGADGGEGAARKDAVGGGANAGSVSWRVARGKAGDLREDQGRCPGSACASRRHRPAFGDGGRGRGVTYGSRGAPAVTCSRLGLASVSMLYCKVHYWVLCSFFGALACHWSKGRGNPETKPIGYLRAFS